MKVKVKYMTEFGSKTTTIDLEKLIWFSKRFSIIDYEIEDVKTLPDIRNKLTPIKNLIKMIENELESGVDINPLIIEEMENCNKSILYLSDN